MNNYPLGQTIDLGPWELRDADGDLTAASSSACTVTLPDGTPATPSVTTASTGIYSAAYTPSAQTGIYAYRAVLTLSDGSVAVNVGEFRVKPNTADLCTIADVKTLRQIPSTDTNQDAVIEELIVRASAVVAAFCGTSFVEETSSAKDFLFRGGRRLDLAPYVARTVTAVVVDPTGASPQTLSASDYSLRPIPAQDGVYRYLRLLTAGAPSRTSGDVADFEQIYRVTGTWGYADIPEAVRHWTTVTVSEWMNRDVQAFSTTLNAATDIVERPESLPRAVRAGLRHFQRILAP